MAAEWILQFCHDTITCLTTISSLFLADQVFFSLSVLFYMMIDLRRPSCIVSRCSVYSSYALVKTSGVHWTSLIEHLRRDLRPDRSPAQISLIFKFSTLYVF